MTESAGEPMTHTWACTRWVWVSLPYATFTVATRDGRVVDAPPIARWTIGRPERDVADYFRRRGAVFQPLDP